MTLKVIMWNGQLRRTTRTIEWAGEAFTALRALVTLSQLLAATSAIRTAPTASTTRRVSHFTCSAVTLVAIQPNELAVEFTETIE